MSVILKGKGSPGDYSATLTSLAGGFADVTLSIPVLFYPDQSDDNVDVIEGDSGYNFGFAKGKDRRIFEYKFALQTDAVKQQVWNWKQILGGRLNWFTMQPHEQPVTQNITCNANGTTLTIKAQLGQATDYWIGYWVFILTGSLVGVRRKITGFTSGSTATITVDKVWGGTSYPVSGDIFCLGYPVRLTDRIIFIRRSNSYQMWDFALNMKEEPVD